MNGFFEISITIELNDQYNLIMTVWTGVSLIEFYNVWF